MICSISSKEYHEERNHISKSGLDLVARGPDVFKYTIIDGNHLDPTPAMVLGSALHCKVLEPNLFQEEYIIAPKVNRRTKAGKEKWEQFCSKAGKRTVLSQEQIETIDNMVNALNSCPAARAIIERAAHKERSYFSHMDEVMVKCRPDIELGNGYLADLKTTTDIDENALARSIYKFRYHVPAAFYSDIVERERPEKARGFIFIFVETGGMHRVRVASIDQDSVEIGREVYRNDLDVYKECLETNHWPGPNNGKIGVISLPAWAK